MSGVTDRRRPPSPTLASSGRPGDRSTLGAFWRSPPGGSGFFGGRGERTTGGRRVRCRSSCTDACRRETDVYPVDCRMPVPNADPRLATSRRGTKSQNRAVHGAYNRLVGTRTPPCPPFTAERGPHGHVPPAPPSQPNCDAPDDSKILNFLEILEMRRRGRITVFGTFGRRFDRRTSSRSAHRTLSTPPSQKSPPSGAVPNRSRGPSSPLRHHRVRRSAGRFDRTSGRPLLTWHTCPVPPALPGRSPSPAHRRGSPCRGRALLSPRLTNGTPSRAADCRRATFRRPAVSDDGTHRDDYTRPVRGTSKRRIETVGTGLVTGKRDRTVGG